MRLVSFYRANRSAGIGLGGFPDGRVLDLQVADDSLPREMNAFLALGNPGLVKAERALELAERRPAAWLTPDFYRLRPPVPNPSKFLLMGLNYKAHVLEGGREIPDKPVLFGRWAQSLIAHGEPVWVPKVSTRVDWEGEFVAVIGREGRHIPRDKALDYVAGYTCFNDVSVRDWQHMTTPAQWTLGKNFDHSGPLGPWIVTADEVGDPHTLSLTTIVNDQVMQEGHTSDLIFDIRVLIELVSKAMTLHPGDLLSTGTPGGVGNARKPPIYLKAGDTVTVSIEKIGELTNPVENEP
ncbi:MAG TPA: fumarylacetoacetate hydrolase family protein [bacterium]|nr:fumarylacetoacetate hydrolase family protein [bacterium]